MIIPLISRSLIHVCTIYSNQAVAEAIGHATVAVVAVTISIVVVMIVEWAAVAMAAAITTVDAILDHRINQTKISQDAIAVAAIQDKAHRPAAHHVSQTMTTLHDSKTMATAVVALVSPTEHQTMAHLLVHGSLMAALHDSATATAARHVFQISKAHRRHNQPLQMLRVSRVTTHMAVDALEAAAPARKTSSIKAVVRNSVVSHRLLIRPL